MAMSLAGLPGCQTEVGEEPADADPAQTVTGEAASALGATAYDFIVNAPGAFWTNNNGGVTWGTNNTGGACQVRTDTMEDNLSHTWLYTQPKWSSNGYMHGSYTVLIPAASVHPTLTATFGFKKNMNSWDGVTFSMTTKVNGATITLFSVRKYNTGVLTTVTADLSAYGGQTLQLSLNADAGPDYNVDVAGWTDVRVTADSVGSPSGGCTINNVAYQNNAVNPAVSCQVCDPTASTTTWTTRADSCLIGGTCYTADTQDSLGCKTCDPFVSQTSWTNKASCDNLIVAVTNSDYKGNHGYLNANHVYPDARCAAEGAALGLPGTWVAMISDDYVSPVRHLKDVVPSWFATMPVVNLQGEQMYADWNSIFTNQVWPAGISIYKFGNATNPAGSATTGTSWTGTNAAGFWDESNIRGKNCSNSYNGNAWDDTFEWASLHARTADYSQRKLLDGGFNESTGYSQTYCGYQKTFQCVLIPTPGQVTVQNYDGTAEGTIQGRAQGDAYAWLGVPYAAAPIGNLRLAPPAKVTSWTGVRNAFNMPTMCAQKGFFPGPFYVGSEDCLYLNVWAPKTAGPTSNLPVFVYHHPGGLMYGGANAVDEVAGMGMFDGYRLAAAQNMIVVTLQTRLAAFGYLALPELSANATSRTSTTGGGTSGNYGLLDAIQSLKWIKRNISKFGGDPNHVTFAGASGGATLVGLLLSSPLSKDPADNKPYFSSTFMMSGFYEEPPMSTRYTQGAALLPTAHCESASDKVACLRAASVNDLTAMAGDFLCFVPDMLNAPTPPDLAFGLKLGPSIDGYVLPAQPRVRMAAGQHQKMPVIIGSTQKEFSSFMVTAVAGAVHAVTTGDINDMVYISTCSAYVARADLNLGTTLSAAARPLYPCTDVLFLGPTTAYSNAMTHVQYECPVRRTARALVTGQTEPVRRYVFTHNADHIGVFQNLLGLVPQVGAGHALDQAYVFNNHSTVVLGLPTYWPSKREVELAGRYGQYIRAFAATGNPNYAGGNNWAAYDRNIDNALSLKVVGETGPSDPGPQMISGISTSYCDFWDNNFTLDGWK